MLLLFSSTLVAIVLLVAPSALVAQVASSGQSVTLRAFKPPESPAIGALQLHAPRGWAQLPGGSKEADVAVRVEADGPCRIEVLQRSGEALSVRSDGESRLLTRDASVAVFVGVCRAARDPLHVSFSHGGSMAGGVAEVEIRVTLFRPDQRRWVARLALPAG